MSDIHALIRDFLQQQSVLFSPSPFEGEGDDYVKAGVIPFLTGKPLRFYVIKPKGMIPGLGSPPFQLCKGTRQYHVPGVGWRDIKDGIGATSKDKETLAETALRESIEELGLELRNIAKLYDMGGYGFTSATTGQGKKMWLFAAEMKAERDFLPDAAVAAATSERKWLEAAEFAVVGRDDHRYILADIEAKLLPS